MERETTPRETIWDWVKTLVLAAVLAYLISNFVVGVVLVPTGSMIPSIEIQDRILSNRFIYRFKPLERGEIVLFWPPDDDESIPYVKRVIGLPGEEIIIQSGQLYLNGEPMEEAYIKEPMYGDFGPYTVPEEHYFMLGDNRNGSNDSRYWDNKYVPKESVIGKAFFRIYPLNRMGRLQ